MHTRLDSHMSPTRCHRPGYATRTTHTLALVPAFLSINSILFILEKLRATTVLGDRPVIVHFSPSNHRLILTPFARRFPRVYLLSAILAIDSLRCSKIFVRITLNISIDNRVRERRFKVAASGGED